MKEQCMLDIAKSRFTTKHYTGEKIPREDLDAILEILRLSPSSVNSQPWHFFVASSDAARAKIAPAFADFNQARVTLASDVIVFAVKTGLDETHLRRVHEKELADGRFAGIENQPNLDAGRRHFVGLHSDTLEHAIAWETQQTYIALGFAMYAAAGMGIHSTCLEGADFEKLDEILCLREKGLKSVVALSLGRGKPDDSNAARPKSRLTPEEVTSVID